MPKRRPQKRRARVPRQNDRIGTAKRDVIVDEAALLAAVRDFVVKARGRIEDIDTWR